MSVSHEITSETIAHNIIDDTVTHDVIIESITHEIGNEQGPPWPKWNPWDGISIEWETPTGVIDWTNTNYALAHTPSKWVRLYVNGVRQKEPGDYTLSSNIISFESPLIPWDILLADYNF